MAKGFLDGCIWVAQSEGIGDFVFTEALNTEQAGRFFSPTEAGAVDGVQYNYTAYLGASREAGTGIWDEDTGTLTNRTPIISTNSNNLVNFPDPPIVIMGGPLAQDMGWVPVPGEEGSASSVTFLNVNMPTGYEMFRLEIPALEVDTSSDLLACALSDDGGSTFHNASSDYSGTGLNSGDFSDVLGYLLGGGAFDVTAGHTINLVIDIFPGSASRSASWIIRGHWVDGLGNSKHETLSGRLAGATGRQNVFRVQPYGNGDIPPTSGNLILSAKYKLFGLTVT